MRKIFLIVPLFFFLFSTKVFAQSDYVLPYPAVMPGSKLYFLQELKNAALHYWYFGNFGQFTYNLKQSDKYLVEAKTLFEYKQYFLGYKALVKSDEYFQKLSYNLENAKKERKNISEKKHTLQNVSAKHIETLERVKKDVPEVFYWQPEKDQPTLLDLRKKIENAIRMREL